MKFLMLILPIILLFSLAMPLSHGQNAQYVILIHGYNFEGTSSWQDWMSGVNIYSQLVSAGYIVGVVSYYGEFYINFSNGYSYSDPNFIGTINTPIENISYELVNSLNNIFGGQYPSVSFVAYSMGGLVLSYAIENYNMNFQINSIVFMATPFDGSPIANVANYLGLNVGYQAYEMESGSSFIVNLQNNIYLLQGSYNITVIAGNYDPWWGNLFFNGDNDGAVSVASAESCPFNYSYIFPDLHSSSMDQFTLSGISYFEDQNVANAIINSI